MKLELQPLGWTRVFTYSRKESDMVAVKSMDFAKLFREMTEEGQFREKHGEFRIYKSRGGVLFLELDIQDDER